MYQWQSRQIKYRFIACVLRYLQCILLNFSEQSNRIQRKLFLLNQLSENTLRLIYSSLKIVSRMTTDRRQL